MMILVKRVLKVSGKLSDLIFCKHILNILYISCLSKYPFIIGESYWNSCYKHETGKHKWETMMVKNTKIFVTCLFCCVIGSQVLLSLAAGAALMSSTASTCLCCLWPPSRSPSCWPPRKRGRSSLSSLMETWWTSTLSLVSSWPW